MSSATRITHTAKLLEASVLISKQRRLIAAQRAYIEVLRERLRERERYAERARAEGLPGLLCRQAE